MQYIYVHSIAMYIVHSTYQIVVYISRGTYTTDIGKTYWKDILNMKDIRKTYWKDILNMKDIRETYWKDILIKKDMGKTQYICNVI